MSNALDAHGELRDMIEWWLDLPDCDPAYRHRTLEQRRSAHAWALADMLDMMGYKKDPDAPTWKRPE